jgi:hypothetical protein
MLLVHPSHFPLLATAFSLDVSSFSPFSFFTAALSDSRTEENDY